MKHTHMHTYTRTQDSQTCISIHLHAQAGIMVDLNCHLDDISNPLGRLLGLAVDDSLDCVNRGEKISPQLVAPLPYLRSWTM